MRDPYVPSGVLLVGSVPGESADEVFMKVCPPLKDRLSSIPDGEVGSRHNYIGWQLDKFPQETRHFFLGGVENGQESAKGFDLYSIRPTEYDRAAISSYATFKELRERSVIPQDIRFQVSLPTPFNCIQGHIRPEFHEELEPLYELRLAESVKRIVEEIPPADLAIQWDLCFDIIALEYDRGRMEDDRFKPYFSPVKKGILERLDRMCSLVPPTVDMGFHLCYGDLRHKHFIEPEDLSVLVELTNDIVQMLESRHSVAWVHMPVPKDIVDRVFFEPLRNLDTRIEHLYLGLVHANDEEGTRTRIDVASQVYARPFGVATECGMGRTPAEDLESILHICMVATMPRAVSLL